MTAAQRREQLLDVTKAIVVADGFHAVSIEAVARKAQITRPIVYGHFKDLGGLLEALVERESRRALEQLPDTYDDLLAALTAYLEAVRTDPDTWRLVLMPQEGAPRLLHERIAAGRAAVVGKLAQAPDRNARPGARGADDVRVRRRGRPPRAGRPRGRADPSAHALGARAALGELSRRSVDHRGLLAEREAQVRAPTTRVEKTPVGIATTPAR